MEDKIKEQIEKIIKEDLPQAVGNELKQFIEEANETKLKLKTATKGLENYADLITKKDNEHLELINKLEEYKVREEKIKAREVAYSIANADLQNDKNEFKVKVMEIKLNEANNRADMVQDFVSNLVKNPTFKKTTITNKTFQHHQEYDCGSNTCREVNDGEEVRTITEITPSGEE